MVEHRARQFLRTVDPARLPFAGVEAGGGLHQRVEAAPAGPWSGMAISRERDIDDPRADPRGVFGREAERRDRARAIALRENIGIPEQAAQHLASLLGLQIGKARQLAAAG